MLANVVTLDKLFQSLTIPTRLVLDVDPRRGTASYKIAATRSRYIRVLFRLFRMCVSLLLLGQRISLVTKHAVVALG